MLGRAQLLSLDCSTLPLFHTLYCWVLNKEVSSTIFKVFGMTRPGIEPRFLGPLSNTLPSRPMSWLKILELKTQRRWGKARKISQEKIFRNQQTNDIAVSSLFDAKNYNIPNYGDICQVPRQQIYKALLERLGYLKIITIQQIDMLHHKCIFHYIFYSLLILSKTFLKSFKKTYIFQSLTIPTWMYTYSKVKVKLATVVEGDLKSPFSIATTLRCRGGR